MKFGILLAIVAALVLASTQRSEADILPEGFDAKFRGCYREAQQAFHVDNYHDTVVKVTVALAMRPVGKDAVNLYQWRGWAYFNLGDTQRALADYNAAIHIDPKIAYGYRTRGWLNFHAGHFAEAASDYTHALGEKAPHIPDLYQGRGDAYLKLGKRELARQDYEKATLRPMKRAADFEERGKLFCLLGENGRAAQDYATAKRMRPSDPYFLNAAAWFEATAPSAKYRDANAALRDATLAC